MACALLSDNTVGRTARKGNTFNHAYTCMYKGILASSRSSARTYWSMDFLAVHELTRVTVCAAFTVFSRSDTDTDWTRCVCVFARPAQTHQLAKENGSPDGFAIQNQYKAFLI